MWSGSAAENNPCPSGFRIPTAAEWNQERLSWGTNNAAGAFASPLKLPMSGYRYYENASLNNVGDAGFYWSSTGSTSNSRILYFFFNTADMESYPRAYGFSIRCIKD
ncbi:MAG: hypothetical protein EAY75_03525 [Bacteroidetes bacterium]|nr:MAG: hypothetical protein EAY75_03525 [Bacteroidota bacterium]